MAGEDYGEGENSLWQRGQVMRVIKRIVYFALWLLCDKSGEYKMRSYLPKYEIEAIVRAFYPAIAAFFETEEGKREFEEWKKREADDISKPIMK